MEEKKLDLNTIIGFVLIGAILLFMLWQQQPSAEELASMDHARKEKLSNESYISGFTSNPSLMTRFLIISLINP